MAGLYLELALDLRPVAVELVFDRTVELAAVFEDRLAQLALVSNLAARRLIGRLRDRVGIELPRQRAGDDGEAGLDLADQVRRREALCPAEIGRDLLRPLEQLFVEHDGDRRRHRAGRKRRQIRQRVGHLRQCGVIGHFAFSLECGVGVSASAVLGDPFRIDFEAGDRAQPVLAADGGVHLGAVDHQVFGRYLGDIDDPVLPLRPQRRHRVVAAHPAVVGGAGGRYPLLLLALAAGSLLRLAGGGGATVGLLGIAPGLRLALDRIALRGRVKPAVALDDELLPDEPRYGHADIGDRRAEGGELLAGGAGIGDGGENRLLLASFARRLLRLLALALGPLRFAATGGFLFRRLAGAFLGLAADARFLGAQIGALPLVELGMQLIERRHDAGGEEAVDDAFALKIGGFYALSRLVGDLAVAAQLRQQPGQKTAGLIVLDGGMIREKGLGAGGEFVFPRDQVTVVVAQLFAQRLADLEIGRRRVALGAEARIDDVGNGDVVGHRLSAFRWGIEGRGLVEVDAAPGVAGLGFLRRVFARPGQIGGLVEEFGLADLAAVGGAEHVERIDGLAGDLGHKIRAAAVENVLGLARLGVACLDLGRQQRPHLDEPDQVEARLDQVVSTLGGMVADRFRDGLAEEALVVGLAFAHDSARQRYRAHCTAMARIARTTIQRALPPYWIMRISNSAQRGRRWRQRISASRSGCGRGRRLMSIAVRPSSMTLQAPRRRASASRRPCRRRRGRRPGTAVSWSAAGCARCPRGAACARSRVK